MPRAPAFVAEAVAQAVSDDALDADFFDTIPESVTAELKPEGPALFAKSLYEMYVASPLALFAEVRHLMLGACGGVLALALATRVVQVRKRRGKATRVVR